MIDPIQHTGFKRASLAMADRVIRLLRTDAAAFGRRAPRAAPTVDGGGAARAAAPAGADQVTRKLALRSTVLPVSCTLERHHELQHRLADL
jgi:hypothetical protein